MSMMLDLARRRYSCRDFSSQPVAPALVEQCLEVACLSPSARNCQPWKFVWVQDAAVRRQVDETIVASGKNAFVGQAPVMLAIVQDGSIDQALTEKYAHGDVGMAVSYLTLAAAELGLDSVILGGFPVAPVAELLQVSAPDRLRLLVLLGYGKAEQPPEKLRQAVAEKLRTL